MTHWLRHAVQFDTKEAAGRAAHQAGALQTDNPFVGLKGTWAFSKDLAAHCWNLGWLEADQAQPVQRDLFDGQKV